jgi:lincosamide nucleotidyltransferase A/C/D/E
MSSASTMDVEAVLKVLATLDDASVHVWLDGGWGVDALLGEQTRDHADLDIILNTADVPKLQEALLAIGFQVKPGGSAANFILADKDDREIDVHPIDFDQRGFGFFQLPDGRRWPFPPAAFAGKGRIGERGVCCLSADAQVQCHGQGYEPTEEDLRDMERLQQRFGVVLPVSLCRQQAREDLAAIQAAAARFLRALDDLDWEPFRASWTSEPTAFLPFGDTPDRVAGRVAVEARWRRFFEEARSRTPGPPYLNLEPLDIRTELYGDVGLVTFSLALTVGGRQLPLQRRTLMFVRERDAWKLAHMHASGASPP